MSSADSKPHARPVRRFRIGFLSMLQIALAAIVFLAVNFLSSQHHGRWDLTDELAFTLSKSTISYLGSEALTGRDKPVEMIVAFPADDPFYDRIRPIAEEYARHAGGHIHLRLIDPQRSADTAESLKAEYGIIFNQGLVILDARSAEQRAGSTARKASPHVHVVRKEDMTVYVTDDKGQRHVRGFLAEDALRAGLVAALEGKPRRMWILADKSDLTSESATGIWNVLGGTLVSQNIQPETVHLAGVTRIPDDVSAVAIIAPVYDLNPEELQVLEEYWARPAAAVLVTTGTAEVPDRLRVFLRKYGVTPRPYRVLTVDDGMLRTNVNAQFTTGLPFIRDLWGKSTTLEGVTRELDIREGADDLLTQGIAPFRLLESTKDFWGESRFPAEAVGFDKDEDHPGPIGLAAAVIRGNANLDTTADDVSRMVVIGNTDFLSPENSLQPNLDFLASCANWLVHRETLAGEGPRNLRLYKLPMLAPQVTFINRVNLVLLPAAFLLIGAMVWTSRRA